MIRKCGLLAGLCLLFLASCGEDDGAEETQIDRFSLQTNTFNETETNDTQMLTLVADGKIVDPVTVTYRFEDGEAKAGDDYTASGGSIELSPNAASGQIPLTVTGDTHFELTEKLELIVTYEGQDSRFFVTIRDNDQLQEIDRDNDGFITPDAYPSMVEVWSDEFDGEMLDEADWNYELGDGCPNLCGWGNNELQVYTNVAENVKLENGQLVITAIKEGNDDFTSARITTKDKVEFAYGRIDVRAKMPKGQGIWPAIWMLGANIDQVSWPACGEIDIMELVGHEPEKVHGTVHYDNNGYQTTSSSTTLSEGDFSDEFHVYTLTWEQNTMSWYVDNNLYKTFIKPDGANYPFNNTFFFIMNIAVGGNWPGNPDGTTVFPQEMTVDYIRVFR